MILILSMGAAYASGDDAIIELVQNNVIFNSIQEQLLTRRRSNPELQILKKQ